MSWTHISDSLPAWLSAEIAKKAAERDGPAVVQGVGTPLANEGHASRSMVTASPTSVSPRSAVIIDLSVWKSSRSPGGRSNEAPAYRCSPSTAGARELV